MYVLLNFMTLPLRKSIYVPRQGCGVGVKMSDSDPNSDLSKISHTSLSKISHTSLSKISDSDFL